MKYFFLQINLFVNYPVGIGIFSSMIIENQHDCQIKILSYSNELREELVKKTTKIKKTAAIKLLSNGVILSGHLMLRLWF